MVKRFLLLLTIVQFMYQISDDLLKIFKGIKTFDVLRRKSAEYGIIQRKEHHPPILFNSQKKIYNQCSAELYT